MKSGAAGLVLTAAMLVGGSVSAAPAADASALFAREALRICLDTAGDPAAIRRLAEQEKWTPVDPLSLPVRNRVRVAGKKKSDERVYQRTAAWTRSESGVDLSVGLFDIAEVPNGGRQCELMAWDLDAKAVDGALRADPRLRDQSFPGLPLKSYAVAGSPLALTYIASDAGSRVLHAFTAR